MKEGIHIAIAPYQLGDFFGMPLTPTLITSWVVVILLLTTAFFLGRKLALVPNRTQTAVEGVVMGVYEYVESTLEDKTLARRYFPLILSIFLFIASANLFGLLPFMGAVHISDGYSSLPLFYPIHTDLNMAIALAVVAVIVIEFAGIATLGFLKYFSKFVNFKSPIAFVVGLIELISEVVRLITFSFRLFGNIFAGKVLILVALSFMPYLLPVPLVVYEVAVSVIQGAIFALLTLFFIKVAVSEPH